MKNRTPNQLPNNLYLGDVDGDGTDEFLQVADNRLLVFGTNSDFTGVLHHYFPMPISHLIIGDFTPQGHPEHGRDQVSVVANGTMYVDALSHDLEADGKQFSTYAIDNQSPQPSIIARGEEVIVGDFDGDGADEILVHNVTNGTLRIYSRNDAGYFDQKPFAPGNLSTANLVGTCILAGTFGQTAQRDDLLVVDYQAGQISRFDSATDSTGATTFWWAFTTEGGVVSRDDQVVVANIDGGPTEGIVIHNIVTGAYRLYRAEYGTGDLVGVPDVSLGQLPVIGNSILASARLKEADKRSEPGGSTRHDFLLFDRDARQVTRTDGRYDPARSQFTYWYAYTNPTPSYHQGWPAKQNDTWAVLLSHLADNDTKPLDANGKPTTATFFKQLFTSDGTGLSGMTDYFIDISYGTLDIGSSEVLPPGDNDEWYKSSYSTANSPRGSSVEDPVDHQMKDARQVLFDDVVRVSGIDKTKYAHIVAVFNVPGTAYGGDPNWVTIDPHPEDIPVGFQTSAIAQEMLHGYNLWHAHDDHDPYHEYGDPWDVMSAENAYMFTGFNQANSGPEINASYKARMGWLPDSRVRTLTPNRSNKQPYTVQLAALNRPEANGCLAVKIPIEEGAADHAFFVEFRQQSFWDQKIPNDCVVLIHEYKDGQSFLQTSQGGPEFMKGMTFQHPLFTVTVKETHGANHREDRLASTATVDITFEFPEPPHLSDTPDCVKNRTLLKHRTEELEAEEQKVLGRNQQLIDALTEEVNGLRSYLQEHCGGA